MKTLLQNLNIIPVKTRVLQTGVKINIYKNGNIKVCGY